MRIASVNQTASGWRPARYFSGWCLIWLATLWVSPSVGAATLLVWTGSPSPAPPYTNWINAAHVIQDAVDLAQAGDTVSVVGISTSPLKHANAGETARQQKSGNV